MWVDTARVMKKAAPFGGCFFLWDQAFGIGRALAVAARGFDVNG